MFSVVLPVKDRADSVGRCAVSVLGQTFADLELLVVDAGSTDATLEAVRLVADRRVRLMEVSADVCAADAGNAASHGRYRATLDADTVVRPHWLARVARLLHRTDATAVACGGLQHHDDHSSTEVAADPRCTRGGAVVALTTCPDGSGFPEDAGVVVTPEHLIDWFEPTAVGIRSEEERRFRWATDAIAALGRSPIPEPDLLARYATIGGLAAARLHDHRQARHLLGIAAQLHRSEFRYWARWLASAVPPLSDRLWISHTESGADVAGQPATSTG